MVRIQCLEGGVSLWDVVRWVWDGDGFVGGVEW